MKPLKDIGQQVEWGAYQPIHITNDSPLRREVVVLTLEERHELVQAVFIRAYKMGIRRMYEYEHQEMGYPQHEWDFEDWIKSEGL